MCAGLFTADVFSECFESSDAVFADATEAIGAGAFDAEFFAVIDGDAVYRPLAAVAKVAGFFVGDFFFVRFITHAAGDAGREGVRGDVLGDSFWCGIHINESLLRRVGGFLAGAVSGNNVRSWRVGACFVANKDDGARLACQGVEAAAILGVVAVVARIAHAGDVFLL